uniref:Haloacid dehalogenase-like hydrolase domain-containing protein 3-like n=1 Tax=Tetraselmis sp. GSL018 TaxID=582737 RepID=A0A061QWK3_9CHLO
MLSKLRTGAVRVSGHFLQSSQLSSSEAVPELLLRSKRALCAGYKTGANAELTARYQATPTSPQDLGNRTGSWPPKLHIQHSVIGSVPEYSAVTVDLFGTLLSEAIGEAKVYAMMLRRHGYAANEEDINRRYQVSYREHKTSDTLRYVGDGKEFWRAVVQDSIGCTDPSVFEDIYSFYELPAAWRVSAGAFPAIQRLRRHGVRTAVVSDFDTRLRALVQSFGLDRAFDHIICSAEVGAEKPDPRIFREAALQLGVQPHQVRSPIAGFLPERGGRASEDIPLPAETLLPATRRRRGRRGLLPAQRNPPLPAEPPTVGHPPSRADAVVQSARATGAPRGRLPAPGLRWGEVLWLRCSAVGKGRSLLLRACE